MRIYILAMMFVYESSMAQVGDEQEVLQIVNRIQIEELLNKQPDKNGFANDLNLKNQIFGVSYLIKPQIKYPENMRKFGNQGRATLRIFSDKYGNLQKLETLQSVHPDIEQIAVQAMLGSKFLPAPSPWFAEQEITLDIVSHPFSQLNTKGVDPFKMPKASKLLPEELQYDEPPIIKVAAPIVYPLNLLKENKKGKAKVYVVIDPSGRVLESKIISSTASEYGLAAKASFESWEFYPAKKNKENSWSVIVKDFDFNLYNRDTKPSDSATKILYNLKKGKDDYVSIQNLDSIPKPLYSPFPKNVSKGEKNKVILEFYLDDDGFVQLPQLVSYQNEEQAWLALTALKRWQFEIPLRDGKPVIAKLTLPLEFE